MKAKEIISLQILKFWKCKENKQNLPTRIRKPNFLVICKSEIDMCWPQMYQVFGNGKKVDLFLQGPFVTTKRRLWLHPRSHNLLFSFVSSVWSKNPQWFHQFSEQSGRLSSCWWHFCDDRKYSDDGVSPIRRMAISATARLKRKKLVDVLIEMFLKSSQVS